LEILFDNGGAEAAKGFDSFLVARECVVELAGGVDVADFAVEG